MGYKLVQRTTLRNGRVSVTAWSSMVRSNSRAGLQVVAKLAERGVTAASGHLVQSHHLTAEILRPTGKVEERGLAYGLLADEIPKHFKAACLSGAMLAETELGQPIDVLGYHEWGDGPPGE